MAGTYVVGDILALIPESDAYGAQRLVTASTTTIDTTARDIFSVNGGFVKIKELWGRVTTEIEDQATTVFMQFDPDQAGGATYAISGTGGDIVDMLVGTIIRYTGDFSANLAVGVDGGESSEGTVVYTNSLFFDGDITIDFGATSTGAITWYLVYESLGGRVTAS